MPSRTSRRLKKLPRGVDPSREEPADTAAPSNASSPPSGHADPSSGGAEDTTAAAGAASGDGNGGSGDNIHEAGHVAPAIRTSGSEEQALAFEPPKNTEDVARSKEATPQRAVHVQIRGPNAGEGALSDANAAASSSSNQAERDAQSPAHHDQQQAAPAPESTFIPARAAFAPPIVTKTTRRETFASSFTSAKSRRKKSGTISLFHSSPDSPQSTSSEEDKSLKDLFSPPPPSSLRTRSRPREHQQQQQMVDDLAATITHSTSLEEPHPEAHHQSRSQYQRGPHQHSLEYAYDSPPTIYTPHTEEGGRMAMSTSQKRHYHGRVVHIPHGKGGEEEREEESSEAVAHQQKSAPARMPVSRRAMGSDHDDRAHPEGSRVFEPLTKGVDYDSGEDIHAALQLSFDDSPENSPTDRGQRYQGQPSPTKKARAAASSASTSRPLPPQQQQHPGSERYPSPGSSQQHAPHPSSATSSERYPPGSSQHPASSSERYPPPQQQQHQQAYQYHPAYYPYHHPGMMGSQQQGGYHYPPPSTSSQGPQPSHVPSYPPPHHAGGYAQHHQWPPSSHGQQPHGQSHHGQHGHYSYPGPHHQHPQYQHSQHHQQYPTPPPPEQHSPEPTEHHHHQQPPPSAGSRTPASKRKVPKSIDTTMETAELSYEEEEQMGGGAGPMSPPSSKKKKDASAAWGSPPREFIRGSMGQETDATPQRGSTFASRKRQGETSGYYHAAAAASTPAYASAYSEIHPTPHREILPAASWSPSAMQAFFDEEHLGGAAAAAGPGGNNNNVSCSSGPQYHPISNLQQEDDGRRPRQETSFTSLLSPRRGGITIRGSPISRKSDRDVSNAAPVPSRAESMHMTPAHGTKPAAARSPVPSSWQTPAASTGMRIKIGSVGMETSEARRGIEGINSVLRGSPVSAPQRTPHSAHHGGLQIYQGADYGAAYAPTPDYRGGPYGMSPARGSEIMMTPAAAARKGTGKENTKNKAESGKCKCKNSKCLKLYCVCFAAERYCFGCKCTNCQNTSQFEAIRNKAIVDTKAKNPNAFKEKMDQTSHATGCKCKNSACLKKYCECFQAGIVCGQKCKCVNCQNFIGSQALIDRRRKIKDHKGAETAMMSAEKAWKGSLSAPRPTAWTESPIVHDPTRMPPGPMMMSPVAFGVSPHHHVGSRPHYPSHHGMVQQSPMSVYPHHPPHHPPYSASKAEGSASRQPPSYNQHPKRAPPKKRGSKERTAMFQKRLDKLRRKEEQDLLSERREPKAAYFGPDVEQSSKSTALNIFSYLTNDDLFNASIVSKKWCDVAFDEGIWASRRV